jgi:mannose-6-phosphate isomerase-like protein (cupin superfamily)
MRFSSRGECRGTVDQKVTPRKNSPIPVSFYRVSVIRLARAFFRARLPLRQSWWHDSGKSAYDGTRHQGGAIKNFLFAFATAAFFPAALTAQEKINPTDPQPTCAMCPGTLVPLAELEAYAKKAIAEKLVDQQVRDIDIGKAHIGIGMVYRGKLDKPAPDSVAEHDQVSEVYHIISGSATLVLGPDIVNRQRRPATLRTVVEFNGPGNNGSDIRNGVAHQIKAGDVVVIPAGTGHWFTKIDDHISYLMVRIDPDKVTPLKGEAQSRDYLSKPARKSEGRP